MAKDKRAIKKTKKIPKVPPGATKPQRTPTKRTVQGGVDPGTVREIERGFRPPGGPQTMKRREKRLMGRPL